MAQARRGGSRARSWTGSRGLPKVSHGSGIYVYDQSGKRYLDASGGPAVFCLGHGHPEVTAAIVQQLERIAHELIEKETLDRAALEELIRSSSMEVKSG